MAEAPRLGLDQPGELRLREPLAKETGDGVVHPRGDGRRSTDALHLPGRLHGPQAHDVAADVVRLGVGELTLEPAELGHRQDVELETKPGGTAAVARDHLRAEVARVVEGDDRVSGVSRSARSASLRTKSVASPSAGT